jgi:hypothetical protein
MVISTRSLEEFTIQRCYVRSLAIVVGFLDNIERSPADRERQCSAAKLGNVTEETRPIHPHPICLPAHPYHPSIRQRRRKNLKNALGFACLLASSALSNAVPKMPRNVTHTKFNRLRCCGPSLVGEIGASLLLPAQSACSLPRTPGCLSCFARCQT